MNDKPDIDDTDEAPAEEPKGPVAGERLAAARRDQQISIDEVAKELHLDEPKVRALERNEFDMLGAPVFAKGHLRKYAQLVGISMDEAVAEYESLNRTPDVPPVVGKVRKTSREISPGPWLAVLLLVLAAGAAYWWFVIRVPAAFDAPEAEIPVPAESVPLPTEEESTDESADESVDDRPPEAAPSSTGTEPTAASSEQPVVDGSAETAALPQPTEAPPAADGQSTLTVRFSGDCWTEITDAGGERLFFALGREGRTVNLVGEAPFSVVFGDADNVSVAIDGEPYAIPAANRSGRMARLTLYAR